MNQASPAPTLSRGNRPAILGAIALVVLLGIVQFFATYATMRPWAWRREMLITLAWWAAWIPLVPIVSRIASRFAFVDGRALVSSVAHATGAAALSLLHLSAVTLADWMVFGPPAPGTTPEGAFLRFLGLPFLVFDFACYGGVAATLLATRFARAYHDEELQAEQLRTRAAGLEATLALAKLDALRMELNPHFLFNSLNAVAGLIGADRPDDAREMLGRLGGLLRRTLASDRSHVTRVADEVEFLRDFLYIEEARFGERLRIHIHVDDEAADCAVPAMLLQPLVENAVRHGAEGNVGVTEVRVVISRDDSVLTFRVDDTGPGFRLDPAGGVVEGIGLSNTRARLGQLFGSGSAMTLSNRPTGGARVEIRIPAAPAAPAAATISAHANAPYAA